jgi:hypothetical protein
MDNTKNPKVPGPGGQHTNDPAGPSHNTIPLTPDIAMQCSIALPAGQRDAFLSDLEAQLRKKFPLVKVFAAPDDQRFGIFVDNSLTSSDAIKQQGTDAINLGLTGRGIVFTIKIDANFMIRTIDAVFAKMPQAFDTDGKPDPNGSIVLQSLYIEFQNEDLTPNSVGTVITGAANVGPISVGFTGKATDTLETTPAGILHVAQHNKVTSDQPVTDVLKFFANLVKWFGGAFFLDIPGQPKSNVLSPAHPTAQLIEMLPAQVLLPGTHQKVVLSYASGDVDDTGVAIHGSLAIEDRKPQITIDMAASTQTFELETGAPVVLGMTTQDMRPPLTIQWTAQDGTVKAPHGDGESVMFEVKGVKPGTSLKRSVTLHVSDADHASRETTKSITIDVVSAPKPTGHGPGSSHEPGTGTHAPGPSTNF